MKMDSDNSQDLTDAIDDFNAKYFSENKNYELSDAVVERLSIPDYVDRDFLRSWLPAGTIGRVIRRKNIHCGGFGLVMWIGLNSTDNGGKIRCVNCNEREKHGCRELRVYRPIDVIKALYVKGIEWTYGETDYDRLKSKADKMKAEVAAMAIERENLRVDIAEKRREIKGFFDLPQGQSARISRAGWCLTPAEILSTSGVAPDFLGGVYFLICNEEIVYVGQSTNMFVRIQKHVKDAGKTFDKVRFLSTPENACEAVESYYINLLNPVLNKKSGVDLSKYDASDLREWGIPV